MPINAHPIWTSARGDAEIKGAPIGLAISKPAGWSRSAFLGLVVIACIWATVLMVTWARWGNVTIDCGREMYVPWELFHGKTLYRDIWYLYGPLAPYLNSVLYRIFGVNLSVLYWAGSLSVLGCAGLIYSMGVLLSCPLPGWTAAVILIAESFGPTLFCFPLPYSFAAVYGCLATCICLWCCIHACFSSASNWVIASGLAASAAILSKAEFGFGCCMAVAAVVIGRNIRSRTRLVRDLFALTPGAVISMAVIGWMISLRGVRFLIQENMAGLPSTYFMQRYGATWSRVTGMSFDNLAAHKVEMSLLALVWLFAVRLILRCFGGGWHVLLAGVAAALVLEYIGLRIRHSIVFARSMFLPPAMVLLLLAAVPIVIVLAARHSLSGRLLALIVLALGTGATALRTLFFTTDSNYSIYYNGPVILAFLLLASLVAFDAPFQLRPFKNPAEALPFTALLAVLLVPTTGGPPRTKPTDPLFTDRGLVYLQAGMARPYSAAIRFMQAAAKRGAATLSVPEDTSLYFFAGVSCPTRVFAFTPGLVAPGRMMNELISEIQTKSVKYIVWSNRRFPEYGTPQFGVDFDQRLAQYFYAHYHRIGNFAGAGAWQAVLWERNSVSK